MGCPQSQDTAPQITVFPMAKYDSSHTMRHSRITLDKPTDNKSSIIYSCFIIRVSCSFSNLLSIRDALNCTETGRLTGCPARVVSPSCPIFPPPHLTFVGFCAVLDRTRWHVSQFRHGDDQIPSGGSFRAVPQQHSIFDLRIARGVRYRKGPVRCVPRYADANLMYGSVHAVRQHDG